MSSTETLPAQTASSQTTTLTGEETPLVWADQPYALIDPPCKYHSLSNPFIFVASHMALAHNTILRGLNTLLLTAPYIPSSSLSSLSSSPSTPGALVRDFLNYSRAWYAFVKLHHTTEETYFFPELEARVPPAKGIAEGNIAQHEAFERHLGVWERWVWDCLEGEFAFSPSKYIALLQAVAEPLAAHLRDEIPAMLSLRGKCDAHTQEFMHVFEQWEKLMRGDHDPAQVGPFVVLNTDLTQEGVEHPYPEMPWYGRFAIRKLLARKFGGAWRFGSTDWWGRPVELWIHGQEARA